MHHLHLCTNAENPAPDGGGLDSLTIPAASRTSSAELEARVIQTLLSGSTTDEESKLIARIIISSKDHQKLCDQFDHSGPLLPINIWLNKDLSEWSKEVVDAYLTHGKVGLEAKLITNALSGLHSGDSTYSDSCLNTIWKILKGNPNREAIKDEISRMLLAKGGSSELSVWITENVQGIEKDEILALLDGDLIRASAARLLRAVIHRDDLTAVSAFENFPLGIGLSNEFIALALKNHIKIAGEDGNALGDNVPASRAVDIVDQVLASTWDNERLKRVQDYSVNGSISDSEKLYYAFTLDGANLRAISEILRNKSKEEIEELISEVKNTKGKTLSQLLEKADKRKVMTLELLLEGKPKDLLGRIGRAESAAEIEIRSTSAYSNLVISFEQTYFPDSLLNTPNVRAANILNGLREMSQIPGAEESPAVNNMSDFLFEQLLGRESPEDFLFRATRS